MITDKDVADKKNEVTMLRLQIAEHKARRRLNEIEQSELNDAPETSVVTLKTPSMGTRVVSKNEETHTIDENKMEAVRMLVGSDMWVLHTDEASVEDKQQKDIIDEMQSTIRALKAEVSVRDGILIGRQSTIDELKNFIREQGRCVDDRDKRIEQLMVLNEALRVDIDLVQNLSRDHIAGQDRTIEGLKSRMTGARIIIDNQATTIEDFKAIETKETDRLHTVIEGNGKIIDELNDMYCDVCGKLEKIEKIAEHQSHDCFSTALDEIIKIIQEE